MGLQRKAIHMMLANPSLSPFDVIVEEIGGHDWALVDHLMMIHKLGQNLYVPDNEELSLRRMACRLAGLYINENIRAKCVVLVKDGCRASKPAVREMRNNRILPPHVTFFKTNLIKIENLMFEQFEVAGQKDRFYLFVNPSQQQRDHPRSPSKVPLLEQEPESRTFVGPGGYVVSSSAAADTTETLLKACASCQTIEADTSMVELANALVGASVMICTGDSDVIAVSAASLRPGVMIRMNNYSYTPDRPMHTSVFADVLMGEPLREVPKPASTQSSSWLPTFAVMCDVTVAQVPWLHPRTRKNHDALLQECGGKTFGRFLQRLHTAGVRGSLYVDALDGLFADGIEVAERRTLVSSERPRDALRELLRRKAVKRKKSCDREEERAEEEDDDDDKRQGPALPRQGNDKNVERLHLLYRQGQLPRGTHGRYLGLQKSGSYFYMMIKENVMRDPALRRRLLSFMVLCGTDYSVLPKGFGVQKLLNAVVTHKATFSRWCDRLWEAIAKDAACQYHALGKDLAYLGGVPRRTVHSYWTAENCKRFFGMMKYVFDLWSLNASERPGPDPVLIRC